MMMLFISSFFIKSFITRGAFESVHSCVFRFMILFRLNGFEQLTAIFTREAFPFVAHHVQLKVVAIVVTFSTDTAEMRILPCVMLNVPVQGG